MPTYDLSNARWRKSSRSNDGNNANCVEVAFAGERAAIRDSKNPGRALVLPVEALRALLTRG
ncbi:MAG TPA: DUF397 domain-containing protein [Pseudonocardiaceae bacterium]|jgi:hypothetical protein|nr:DUF397 domain-containing protein [Pseudonocardiaceae bacterium]